MSKTIIKLDEDKAKELEIIRLRLDGLYQLFISFMNDKFELYNEVKLEEFIDEYSNVNLLYESLINGHILNAIGNEKYKDYISPCIGKCRFFDYPNAEITIVWHDEKEQQEKH